MNHEYEFRMENALDDLPFRTHVVALMRITYQVEPGFSGAPHEPPYLPGIDFLKVECIDAELCSRDGERSMNIFADLSRDDFEDIASCFDAVHRDSDKLYDKLIDYAEIRA